MWPCALTASVNTTDHLCNGGSASPFYGTADVVPSGGTPPYSYVWNTGSTQQLIGGPAGLYTVTVTDAMNCVVTASGIINEPPAITVNAVITDETILGNCDGAIDITVSGGTPGTPFPYLISWSNGVSAEDLTNLCSGTYTVYVTDANNCNTSQMIPVNSTYSLTPLTLDNIPIPFSCGDVHTESMVTILLEETMPDAACPYECNTSVDATSIWLQGAQLVVDLSTFVLPEFVSFIEIDITDYDAVGSTVAWINNVMLPIQVIDKTSNSTLAFEILTLSNHGQIDLTDLRISGCNTQVHEIRIYTETASPLCGFVVNPIMADVSCHGGTNGSVAVNLIGGFAPYAYAWNNGNTTSSLSNIPAGNYAVSITDATGCEEVHLFPVIEPDELKITGASITSETAPGACDANIDASVFGGLYPYTYAWNTGANTEDLYAICNGNHQLTITDMNGCSTSQQFTVATPASNSNGFYIELDMWSGVEEAGGVDNYKEAQPSYDINGWYHYPNQNWHATWFDNLPFDSLGYKEVTIDFDLTVGTNGYIDFALNWTTPAWDTLGYNRPALPYDSLVTQNESQYIMRQVLLQGATTQTNQHHTYTFLIPDYCPGWVSVDVRGYGFELTNGVIEHVCQSASESQNLNLPGGWGIVSSYIEPTSSNMIDVFADIANNVAIVKNEVGSVYWPAFGLNTIGSWVNGEGYQLKMSGPDTLKMEGAILNPATTPVSLPTGWSLFGYLCQEPQPITTMLNSVASDLVIVKDAAGAIYWPAFGLDMIGNMNPGEGFQANMNITHQLYYPCSSKCSISFEEPSAPVKYTKPTCTDNNMTLGIPLWAWETLPSDGSEVAVVNANGQIVGAGSFNNTHLSITIWGDDGYSDAIDGMQAGEHFTLKIHDALTQEESNLTIEDWEEGKAMYSVNGISIAKKVTYEAMAQKFEIYQNAPNPFSQSTTIRFYFPEASSVDIEIIDLMGKTIDKLHLGELSQGEQNISYSNNNLTPGTYYYRISNNKTSLTQKMTIID